MRNSSSQDTREIQFRGSDSHTKQSPLQQTQEGHRVYACYPRLGTLWQEDQWLRLAQILPQNRIDRQTDRQIIEETGRGLWGRAALYTRSLVCGTWTSSSQSSTRLRLGLGLGLAPACKLQSTSPEHSLHGEGISIGPWSKEFPQKEKFSRVSCNPAGNTAEDNFKLQILLPPSMRRSQPQGMMGLQALLHHTCFMQC